MHQPHSRPRRGLARLLDHGAETVIGGGHSTVGPVLGPLVVLDNAQIKIFEVGVALLLFGDAKDAAAGDLSEAPELTRLEIDRHAELLGAQVCRNQILHVILVRLGLSNAVLLLLLGTRQRPVVVVRSLKSHVRLSILVVSIRYRIHRPIQRVFREVLFCVEERRHRRAWQHIRVLKGLARDEHGLVGGYLCAGGGLVRGS